jgi:hypothetical protein
MKSRIAEKKKLIKLDELFIKHGYKTIQQYLTY